MAQYRRERALQSVLQQPLRKFESAIVSFTPPLRFALRLHQRLVYGGRSFLLNAWIPFLPPRACSVSGRGKVIGKNVDVLANCVAGYRYGVEVRQPC